MKNFVVAIAGTLLLTSCGPIRIGPGGTSSNPPPKKITSFSFDGIKLINSGIKDGQDPRTFKQAQYEVNPESRLLIRFESLKQSKESIVIGPDDDIWLRVTIANETQHETALANAKICPLTRGDWMMLASWKAGHPFSRDGKWLTPGGDFDLGACVKAEKTMTGDPNSGTDKDQFAVYFKITRWFRDYVLGRNVNYGHIMLSDQTIDVFGDASGSYSPRILWTEKNQ